MKAIAAYESSDGKIFKTMKECVLHETGNNAKFYDEYCETLELEDTQSFRDSFCYLPFLYAYQRYEA